MAVKINSIAFSDSIWWPSRHLSNHEHKGITDKALFCVSRCFGGLLLDIKRKAPHYLSDYTDALSLQCVASFLFLYCACMSPVITFGGLLGEATEGRIVNLTLSPQNVHNALPGLGLL